MQGKSGVQDIATPSPLHRAGFADIVSGRAADVRLRGVANPGTKPVGKALALLTDQDPRSGSPWTCPGFSEPKIYGGFRAGLATSPIRDQNGDAIAGPPATGLRGGGLGRI